MSVICRQRLLDIANLMALALELGGIHMVREESCDDDLVATWKSSCGRAVFSLHTTVPDGEYWDDEPCLMVILYWTEESATGIDFLLNESALFFVVNGEEMMLKLHLQAMKEWEINLESRDVKIPAPMMLRAVLAHLRCPPNLT